MDDENCSQQACTNFIRPGWELTADFISTFCHLFISREYQEAFMRAAQPPLTSDPRPVTGNIFRLNA